MIIKMNLDRDTRSIMSSHSCHCPSVVSSSRSFEEAVSFEFVSIFVLQSPFFLLELLLDDFVEFQGLLVKRH